VLLVAPAATIAKVEEDIIVLAPWEVLPVASAAATNEVEEDVDG
jgi:hypothetical protein